jgi:hypothetical protein
MGPYLENGGAAQKKSMGAGRGAACGGIFGLEERSLASTINLWKLLKRQRWEIQNPNVFSRLLSHVPLPTFTL